MSQENQRQNLQSFISLIDETIARIGILPLSLLFIGILFFIVGLVIVFKPSTSSVVIIDEATGSGKKASIQVDIEGAVMRPGVYQLPMGARAQDGLIAAGGLSRDADREYVAKVINQAARLTDGGKIYIPSVGETKGQTHSQQDGALLGSISLLININTALALELDTLPGVGPLTAEKIISGRPYQSIEELIELKIVNQGVWGKIRDKITVY